ncbi:putative holin-like toxin [Enterococcus sp. BWB1-3]|nr:putative holin-like toxin [Enterococcus sp. BWB1-3]MBL1228225.1 putative holin-like toxin [Enterococcus sp. BWB1-3]
MKVSANSRKGERLLSALETIQLLFSFSMLVIALVNLLKNDKKITVVKL